MKYSKKWHNVRPMWLRFSYKLLQMIVTYLGTFPEDLHQSSIDFGTGIGGTLATSFFEAKNKSKVH